MGWSWWGYLFLMPLLLVAAFRLAFFGAAFFGFAAEAVEVLRNLTSGAPMGEPRPVQASQPGPAVKVAVVAGSDVAEGGFGFGGVDGRVDEAGGLFCSAHC